MIDWKNTLLLALLLIYFNSNAQHTYKIEILGETNDNLEYTDTISFSEAVNKQISTLRSDQYLLANVDSTSTTNSVTTAHIYKGDQYRYGKVSFTDRDRLIIQEAGLRKYRWDRKEVSEANISAYMETLLVYLEDHGYPFAQVQLDSIAINQGKIDAQVVVHRGPLVTWDSLLVRGSIDIRKDYLRRYLEVYKGEPYSRAKFRNIKKRLGELPFLELKADPRLRFYEKRAEIYIAADKVRSSRFDFLIGVLPSTVGGERRFTISGEFTGELYNRLGYGEYIYARVERLRPEVQELEVKFSYPYIAGLPIGAATGLKVYRRSDQFIEVDANVGLDYQLSGMSHLQASWNFKSSRLIDVDTASILRSKRLPKNLDVSYQGGRIGFDYNNLDYKWNPSSGIDVKIGATIGQKSILPNTTIQSLHDGETSFAKSYDTLQLHTLQLKADVDISYYIPMAKIITLKTNIKAGLIYNQSKIYENEYYRIGGNKILRGFDEQSVLAEGFGIFSAEMRLLLDRNSYLTLPFLDFGYTRVVQGDEDDLVWDQVLGLGIGINFSTPAGIFNVTFASGSRLGNPVNFNDTKVHFGYVSLF